MAMNTKKTFSLELTDAFSHAQSKTLEYRNKKSNFSTVLFVIDPNWSDGKLVDREDSLSDT
ncbi:MAG: hypothetical protein V3V15_03120 [Sphingorhabdus sp.]